MEPATCLYASKPCENPRSFKDNGQLHRLCTHHRIKANDAQRRWHSRQRAPTSPISATIAPSTAKPATKKRRRAARADSTDDSSESDVAQVPAQRRRRTRKLATLARPMAMAMPPSLPTDFTGLLTTTFAVPPPAPPQSYYHAPIVSHDTKLSDEDLAQLSDFILELEETKFHDTFGQDGFETEWWLANVHWTEPGVYCL